MAQNERGKVLAPGDRGAERSEKGKGVIARGSLKEAHFNHQASPAACVRKEAVHERPRLRRRVCIETAKCT